MTHEGRTSSLGTRTATRRRQYATPVAGCSTAARRARAWIALLGLCAAACAAPHEEAEPPAGPALVKLARVHRGLVEDAIAVSGETDALRIVRIASPIAGRIASLSVEPGRSIARGAVVARVVSLENEAAVAGLDRMMRESPGMPDLASLRRDAARDVPVRSPLAGLVSARLHAAGEQVAAGDALVEAFDPATLVAVADVPVVAAARIRPGMAAEIDGAGFTGGGSVEAVVPTAAAGALTVPVRITPHERPTPALLHSPVRVRILIEKRAALLVPRSALSSSGATASAEVMIVRDGHAAVREITVGATSGDSIEVVSGLAEGEAVIGEGGYGLADGAAIRTEPPAAESPS